MSSSVSVRNAIFVARAAVVFSPVRAGIRTFFHSDLTKKNISQYITALVGRSSIHKYVYIARFF